MLTRRLKGSETHDTYYVYDDLGQLRFVLQPMYQQDANPDRYAFQYRYDARGRCIRKKLPGADYTTCTYDNADRLTFAQDGNRRTQGTPKWSYYLYDNLSRLTEQGECTNTSTLAGKSPLVKNYYDTYADFRTATGNNANYPDGLLP